jgi:hypothetical protein
MKWIRRLAAWWKAYETRAMLDELDEISEFPPSLEGISWGVGIDR